MGESKRRKENDPNYGTSKNIKDIDFINIVPPGKLKNYERANLAWRYCYYPLPEPMIRYDEEDSVSACDIAYETHIYNINNALKTHPVLKIFKTASNFKIWFDCNYYI